MNVEFLKKEFAKPLFVRIYKEYLVHMEELFEEENFERIDRFSKLATMCWERKRLDELRREKKLPWVHSHREKVRHLAQEMLRHYHRVEPNS